MSARHPDARDQPTQIPLPAAWVRLVEVVEVDHQIAFRRGVEAKIAEVRIATHHGCDPGRGQSRDVLRHDDRGATQEAVRRVDHSADSDRNEPIHTALVADVDQVDWIRSPWGRRPVRQRLPRNLLAQTLSERVPLGARHRTLAQGAIRPTVGFGQYGVLASRCVAVHGRGLPRAGDAAQTIDENGDHAHVVLVAFAGRGEAQKRDGIEQIPCADVVSDASRLGRGFEQRTEGRL